MEELNNYLLMYDEKKLEELKIDEIENRRDIVKQNISNLIRDEKGVTDIAGILIVGGISAITIGAMNFGVGITLDSISDNAPTGLCYLFGTTGLIGGITSVYYGLNK